MTPAEAEVAQLAAPVASSELARAAAMRSGVEPPMLKATSRSTQPASPPR